MTIVHNAAHDLTCGACGHRLYSHPVSTEFTDCQRSPEPTFGDYWVNPQNPSEVFPYEDLTGNAAGITDLLDNAREWEMDDLHAYHASETERYDHIVNSWSDQEPDTCTHAIDRWLIKSDGTRVQAPYRERHLPKGFREDLDNLGTDKRRSAYVEGFDGYTTQQLIDFHLTTLYQQKLFNVYYGNVDLKLRVGGLRIERSEETISATCYHQACYNSGKRNTLTVSAEATRREMEDFTLAVIRHGNNHGPSWYTTRQDFAYIHATTCDTLHKQGHPCNHNHTERTLVELTDSPESLRSVMNFLSEHVEVCKVDDCQCFHYYTLISAELWNKEHPLALDSAVV